MAIITSIIACSNTNDDLGYIIEQDSIPIIDEPYNEPYKMFEPHIVKISCFTGSIKCKVDIPNDEKYTYSWSHNGAAIGHESTTSCLCGGDLELRVVKVDVGATYYAEIELPPCNELTK